MSVLFSLPVHKIENTQHVQTGNEVNARNALFCTRFTRLRTSHSLKQNLFDSVRLDMVAGHILLHLYMIALAIATRIQRERQ